MSTTINKSMSILDNRSINQEVDIVLEQLAQALGMMISDLHRYSMQKKVYANIANEWIPDYKIEVWNRILSYIDDVNYEFQSYEDIEKFIKRRKKA